ncbi:hypothetical protein Trydic_g5511 [Trypoxylus dichotomus]
MTSTAAMDMNPAPPLRDGGGIGISSSKRLIEESLQSGSYEQAMALAERRDPIYYIGNIKRLVTHFQSKYDEADNLLVDRCVYDREMFIREFVTEFWTVRVLVGRTEVGKMHCALAHFRRPLHIRENEDWRRLTGKTDGVVLSDIDIRQWSPSTFLKIPDI